MIHEYHLSKQGSSFVPMGVAFILENERMELQHNVVCMDDHEVVKVAQLKGWTFKKMRRFQDFYVNKVSLWYDEYWKFTCEPFTLEFDCSFCDVEWVDYEKVLKERLNKHLYAKKSTIRIKFKDHIIDEVEQLIRESSYSLKNISIQSFEYIIVEIGHL